MIVVSVRLQSRPRSFELVNRLEQPLPPSIGELNFPDLLSGIDDKRIWNANFHLVFDVPAAGLSSSDVRGPVEYSCNVTPRRMRCNSRIPSVNAAGPG